MDAKLLKKLMDKKSNETTNKRLESLRLPRDLSLGGTKPKKIFEPNVNAQRTKHKAKETKKVEPIKKEKLKSQPKKKVPDTKRYVQSEGVFSGGSAPDKKYSGSFSRSKYESDPAPSLTIPTFKKTDCIIDDEKEDNMMNNLIDMKLEHHDDKLENADTWNYTPKYDSFFKVEEHGAMDPYFCKIEEAESNTRLALIKMPESLAGKGLSDDPKVTRILDYHLGMMTEGRIGTLQVTRSGKIYMKIGKMRYLMEEMHSTGGPETVASYMSPENEGSNAKFVILGDVEGRFQLIPQWKKL